MKDAILTLSRGPSLAAIFDSLELALVSFPAVKQDVDKMVLKQDGMKIVVKGAGFLYSADWLSAGTIDAIKVSYKGKTLAKVTDIALDGALLANVVAMDRGRFLTAGVENLLMGLSWEINLSSDDDKLKEGDLIGDELPLNLAGDDLINGFDGRDNLFLGDGNDTAHGGLGNDKIFGGAGFDEIYGDEGRDKIFGGDDSDYLYGGDDNDTIKGGFGADTLFGQKGDDKLVGQEDNDTMIGAAGNDTLNGGDGNDNFDGGKGNDLMTGGPGIDTFYFVGKKLGTDVITDFTDGEDRLWLDYDAVTIKPKSWGVLIEHEHGSVKLLGADYVEIGPEDFYTGLS